MTNFLRMDMGENGMLETRLEGSRMEHFADDNSVALTSPNLEIFDERRPPWRVSSQHAWIDSDHDAVLLSGEVQVWRSDEQGKLELQVNTESAIVFPKLRYAEGDQAVTVKLQNTVVNAVGFRADLMGRRVEFLKRVKTRYEVQRNP